MDENRPLTLEFKRAEIPAMRFVTNFIKREFSLDLTPIQCEIFIILKENGEPIIQSELQQRLDVSKSTLSGVLQTMQKNDYIKKSVCETDKRISMISLTDHGLKVYDDVVARFDELDRVIFKGLNDDQLSILREAFVMIRHNIGSDPE